MTKKIYKGKMNELNIPSTARVLYVDVQGRDTDGNPTKLLVVTDE